MKWGVRRYQDKSGKLTTAGKKRYSEVASSEKLQKRDTKRAIKSYKKMAKTSEGMSKFYNRMPFKNKNIRKMAKQYEMTAKYANKKINDISKGKIKAGRDFIVQHDVYYSPIPMLNASAMALKKALTSTKKDPVYISPTTGEMFVNYMIGVYRDDTVIEKK